MADLVLTVPTLLSPEIFPWCAVVLRDYLNHNKSEAEVHIWDLRDEEQILVLFEEYRDCISKIVNLLHKAEGYLGHKISAEATYASNLRGHYVAEMLKFGSDLFSVLQSEKIPFDVNLRSRYEEQLNELKQNFETIIQNKVREHLGGQRRGEHYQFVNKN